MAALAANPGCARRAILDGAGVNKAALASALGSPSAFGQSQFALTRGNAFEAKVKADGGAELLRLVHEKLDRSAEPPVDARVPDLTATGPRGRTARTELELREATAHPGAWTLLDHPMLALDVAGSPAFLEPDAVVVHPDGSWTVVEIKSFPLLDGSADPAKVGAAARQAAVYVLALEELAARLGTQPEGPTARLGTQPEGPTAHLGTQPEGPTAHLGTQPEGPTAHLGTQPEGPTARLGAEPEGGAGAEGAIVPVPRVRHRVLLVCPRDFSNQPAASAVDIRKQRAVTARQLARLTRIEDIADALPEGTCFSPELPAEALTAAVESVPATYAPECLSACELAFHCRTRSRQEGAVTSLGRPVRAELGGLTTVEDVLAAARGEAGDPDDPAVAALRRAAALRAEALEAACR
ncbi:hypothetical protein GCM10010234_05130 [Streptomyces hawaiiensis]